MVYETFKKKSKKFQPGKKEKKFLNFFFRKIISKFGSKKLYLTREILLELIISKTQIIFPSQLYPYPSSHIRKHLLCQHMT